ncbi:hypothetical protein K470DRAFT_254899 [Piedraia hortae CBS 480.64]|uniref:Uncharacterized protein n=1 Tax=Piedraia hortae CBS 480.64 TaxID=1314780 RepID=A0A6A7C7X8_9PEZI|nr:hypothetical protein K470DRAFT_254899 [Piedraia hortae CBS 480.64]
MHYIRFLKVPRVVRGCVEAMVTVTTDLGETFYPLAIGLVVCLEGDKGEGVCEVKVDWKGKGIRSVSVLMPIGKSVEWPARIHAYAGKGNGFLEPIIGIWSGGLDPRCGQYDSGWRVERRFITEHDESICLYEEAGDSIARHLWDGSQALARFLDRAISKGTGALATTQRLLKSPVRAIELGCGCACVGLTLALRCPGSDVLLTDMEEVRELAEANISLLKDKRSRVSFNALDWEEAVPQTIIDRQHNLVVVSECTYNSDTLAALVATLSSLIADSPKALILVATKTRHASEAEFFPLMKQAGFVINESIRLPLVGEPGSGYADSATDVGLYEFLWKSSS